MLFLLSYIINNRLQKAIIMIKQNIKNQTLNGLLAFALVFSLGACNNPKKEDPKDVAEEHNDSKFDNKNEKDAQFLVDAAEINLKEIQLGQLAQTNAQTADVKDLGKMMEEQHTKTMNELKDLAAKKMVTVPTTLTDDGQDDYKKLADKKAKDFDKDYCDMMVKGHKDAIDKFEKASTECNDADIKEWASMTLPALRNHLDHALACQDKLKKM
jgi:putative membrane protein